MNCRVTGLNGLVKSGHVRSIRLRARIKILIATEVSAEEFAVATKQTSLQPWNKASVRQVYENVLFIIVQNSHGELCAAWCCPTDRAGSARRQYRVLPYAAPWVNPSLHVSKRRKAIAKLGNELQALTNEVDLPLDPAFTDISGFLFCGYTLELRHTRILNIKNLGAVTDGYLRTTRSHIRHASRLVSVQRSNVAQFQFAQAIVNQSTAAVQARARSARYFELLGDVIVLNAVDGNSIVVGGILLLRNGNTAVCMHSWFKRGIRGTPSLLIHEAITASKDVWGSKYFDFEGSVLPNIDNFMAGFGAPEFIYGQLRWAKVDREVDYLNFA